LAVVVVLVIGGDEVERDVNVGLVVVERELTTCFIHFDRDVRQGRRRWIRLHTGDISYLVNYCDY
jgi:hypothetical protein